jgi:hypothetical protein
MRGLHVTRGLPGASMMGASEGAALEMPGTPVRKRSVRESHAAKTVASESHAAKSVTAESHAAKPHPTAEMPEPTTAEMPEPATSEAAAEARLSGVGPQTKRAETKDD